MLIAGRKACFGQRIRSRRRNSVAYRRYRRTIFPAIHVTSIKSQKNSRRTDLFTCTQKCSRNAFAPLASETYCCTMYRACDTLIRIWRARNWSIISCSFQTRDKACDTKYFRFGLGDETELLAKTKKVTGGIDAAIDFVGIPATISKAVETANKVNGRNLLCNVSWHMHQTVPAVG